MSAAEDCIFCRIVAGEVPCTKVIETNRVLSFLDISPVNKGHALVVPKRHAGTLLELNQEELHGSIFIVQRVARAVMRATDADGFNVLQNNNEVASQEVPHVHFHVIPRFEGDGFDLGWRQGSYEEGEMERLQREMRQHL
jgi:histidine triad (HIT) family protein